MIDIKELPDDVMALKSIITQQQKDFQKEKSKLENKIDVMLEEIELWKKRLFGPKSEKYYADNDEQQQLFNEAEMGYDEETEIQEKETRTEVKAHTRAKKGRKKLPASLPRVVKEIDIPESDKTCAAGKKLKFIRWEESEKLDIKPPEVKVVVIKRAVYGCPDPYCVTCGEQGESPIKTAPVPPQLLEKTIVTPGLLSYLITSKFCDHLPYYRQEKIYSRYNIDITRQSMCRWTIKVYQKYQILEELLRKELLSGPLIGIDETTMQVITESGRSAKTKSYLWVFRGGNPRAPTVMFMYRETRSAKFLLELLKEYSGYIQTDGYKGYNDLKGLINIILVACWAHARRKFYEAAKASKNKGSAKAALSMIQQLYLIEKKTKDMNAEQRKQVRQKESVPVLNTIKDWLDKKKLQVLPESLIGKAVGYALNLWPRLIRYVNDGNIPIDNNGVENAIRPECLGKKNWLFAYTPSGANASAFFYGLIETAKANGLEPYWYLRYLFDNIIHAETEEDFRMLLPQYADRGKIREYRLPEKWD